MLATDVQAVTVEVHLAVIVHGLGCRDGGGEGGTGGRVIVGRVEGGGHRVGVEDVGERCAVVHHGRANGREAKVLLEGTC